MGENSSKGCAPTGFGLLLGFAAMEGGIVLIAWSLHEMLGGGFDPLWVGGAIAGVLILFAGPELWYLSAGARKLVTWRQAAAALPDLALAGYFIVGWAAPRLIGANAAGVLPAVMVMEFVIIHASLGLVAFPQQMAPKTDGPWWKTPKGARVGLLALYSILAAGISASVGSVWLFVGFWMLMGNKFIGDWLAPAALSEARTQQHTTRWATSACLYLVLAFGSVFLPVPRLGATSSSSGDGLWETHPEQAVMMGAMYFALLGFCELYGAFNKPSAGAISGSAAAP